MRLASEYACRRKRESAPEGGLYEGKKSCNEKEWL
jgi:hypothetical protein